MYDDQVDLATVASNAAKLWVEMEIGRARLAETKGLLAELRDRLGLSMIV